MRSALILMGDGINSENELALAFSRQGAKVKKVHVNDLINNPKMLLNYQLLALPGGFSFGDEIRSGKILAEKMKDVLTETLAEFKDQDGRVIGICNGFQVLGQLGAFDKSAPRSFTLAENSHGTFINRWTQLTIRSDNQSPWFKNLRGEIFLPVRHKEGRIVIGHDASWNAALTYNIDINGSHQNIAGITDESGQIFGLMPHPEVACHAFLHPFQDGAEANAKNIQQLFINGLS
jgi:phosphoribosylformylglycinamidine (FGAM) synthase-like amidotransferase family enzyme